jgi:hypothetical protein
MTVKIIPPGSPDCGRASQKPSLQTLAYVFANRECCWRKADMSIAIDDAVALLLVQIRFAAERLTDTGAWPGAPDSGIAALRRPPCINSPESGINKVNVAGYTGGTRLNSVMSLGKNPPRA